MSSISAKYCDSEGTPNIAIEVERKMNQDLAPVFGKFRNALSSRINTLAYLVLFAGGIAIAASGAGILPAAWATKEVVMLVGGTIALIGAYELFRGRQIFKSFSEFSRGVAQVNGQIAGLVGNESRKLVNEIEELDKDSQLLIEQLETEETKRIMLKAQNRKIKDAPAALLRSRQKQKLISKEKADAIVKLNKAQEDLEAANKRITDLEKELAAQKEDANVVAVDLALSQLSASTRDMATDWVDLSNLEKEDIIQHEKNDEVKFAFLKAKFAQVNDKLRGIEYSPYFKGALYVAASLYCPGVLPFIPTFKPVQSEDVLKLAKELGLGPIVAPQPEKKQ